MFDRPKSGERALLVHVDFTRHADNADLAELRELARSAGALVVAEVTAKREAPDRTYYIGSGKLEEIQNLIAAHDIHLVLFNHAISPSQERNVEKALNCRVLDRTGLILDIFAGRAQTFEGKLQVELAQLKYMSTRLVRAWTHLERQKGGIGLRGPGETQLEMDKRIIKHKIKVIRERLEKVRQNRDLSRQARRRSETATISLVGYTNAGKSTLFNRLTDSHVYAADQLFATLDPTLRRIQIPHLGAAVLVDTVGFIRNLPHDLVESFRATLEETVEADLLLHVIDASDPEHDVYKDQVYQVLKEIHAEHKHIIEVYNKIDLLPQPEAEILRDADRKIIRVSVSAATGLGVDKLLSALSESLQEKLFKGRLHLSPKMGRMRASLYENKYVLKEEADDEGGWCIEVALPEAELAHLCRIEGISVSELIV